MKLEIGKKYEYDNRTVELLTTTHPSNENVCAVMSLHSNELFWVNKRFLKEIVDTSHLKGLFVELDIEVEKASSCDKYYGLVFVHPEDVELVVRYVFNLHDCEYDYKLKQFRFNGGGVLKVDTIERGGSAPHHNYAGECLTTIIIHNDCFGKYDSNFKFECVNPNNNREEFIMYMLTRNRSESKCPKRFVYV
jgi:hypothetical protein